MKLKLFRERLGLSQKDMAIEIGVSTSYYSKVESCFQNPSYKFLVKFKKRFPVASVDEIFFGK